MTPIAPTSEEIEVAHKSIERDGTSAPLTIALGLLCLRSEVLKTFLNKVSEMAAEATPRMGDARPYISPVMRAALQSALMSGLNLGLRIGAARAKGRTDEAATFLRAVTLDLSIDPVTRQSADRVLTVLGQKPTGADPGMKGGAACL